MGRFTDWLYSPLFAEKIPDDHDKFEWKGKEVLLPSGFKGKIVSCKREGQRIKIEVDMMETSDKNER